MKTIPKHAAPTAALALIMAMAFGGRVMADGRLVPFPENYDEGVLYAP